MVGEGDGDYQESMTKHLEILPSNNSERKLLLRKVCAVRGYNISSEFSLKGNDFIVVVKQRKSYGPTAYLRARECMWMFVCMAVPTQEQRCKAVPTQEAAQRLPQCIQLTIYPSYGASNCQNVFVNGV